MDGKINDAGLNITFVHLRYIYK